MQVVRGKKVEGHLSLAHTTELQTSSRDSSPMFTAWGQVTSNNMPLHLKSLNKDEFYYFLGEVWGLLS